MSENTSLGLQISLIARLLRRRFDKRARGIRITRAQWRVIVAVDRTEGLKQRQIAAMLEVGEMTASRLIDKLVDRGWIERRFDPGDRRVNRLYLTAQARPVLEALQRLGGEEESRAFGALSPAEQSALGAVLDTVIARLSCSESEGGEVEADR